MAQGARSFRHLFVKRGRMGQQLDTEALLQQVDDTWELTPVEATSGHKDRTNQ